jgi:hypothetical protein
MALFDLPNANVLRFSASEDTPPLINAIATD